MSTIVPHLWFDTQAREAAQFYAATFPDSSVTSVQRLHGTPDGDVDVVAFRVWGQDFMAINAGPQFSINPSISFIVNVDPSRVAEASAMVDELWAALVDGGTVVLPLGEYPHSPRYGWVQDRFGVSWQLMLTDPAGDDRPAIVPVLTFVGDANGHAEAAIGHYVEVFEDSEIGQLVRHPEGGRGDAGTVMFADFRLGDTWLAAMDGGRERGYGFNEAVSLLVPCADQAQIDRYASALSTVPEAEACGWLKDPYGVSWQITTDELTRLLTEGTPEQTARVTQVFMAMKRVDVAALRAAYQG